MDQFDTWQVVPRQVFTPYSRLLISTAFVVVSHMGCLGVSGVVKLSGEMVGLLVSLHIFNYIKLVPVCIMK